MVEILSEICHFKMLFGSYYWIVTKGSIEKLFLEDGWEHKKCLWV